MKSRIWAKYSYRTARLLLGISYFFGVLPVVFDMSQLRVRMVESKWQRARCWIVSVVQILCTLLIAGAYFVRLRARGLDLESIHDIAHSLFAGALLFCAFLLLHSIWQLNELLAMISGSVAFYEGFQDKYAQPGITVVKEDVLCALLKVFYFCSLIGFGACAVGAYVIRCDFNVLAPLIQEYMCVDNWTHRDRWLVPFLAMAQLFLVTTNFLTIFLYCDIMLAMLVFGKYVSKELGIPEPEARTIALVRESEADWFHLYRCFQIVIILGNNAIGDMFLPLSNSFIMGMGILGMYTLIRLPLNPLLLTMILIELGCIYFYFVYLIKSGSEVIELSSDLISYRKRRSRSKYAERMIASLSLLRPMIGPFSSLNKSTVLSMLSFMVDTTLELLLM